MKTDFPLWCESCGKQGFVVVDDPVSPYFAVCEKCGWETSLVYCPKCEMGGQFVEGIASRPASWTCPKCDTLYELPSTFYDQPVPLLVETRTDLETEFLFREHLDIRFLHGGKWGMLLYGALLGGPSMGLLPLVAAAGKPMPLPLLLLPFLLNIVWSLFVGFAHRPMSWSTFESLPALEQRGRMFYESFWYYLYVSGLAFFPVLVTTWTGALILFFAIDQAGEVLAGMVVWLILSILLAVLGTRALRLAYRQRKSLLDLRSRT